MSTTTLHDATTEPCAPAPRDTLGDVCLDVAEWQRETFAKRTLRGAVNHLAKEAGEIVKSAADYDEAVAIRAEGIGAVIFREELLEELADAVFLIVQATDLIARGEDPIEILTRTIRTKLTANKERTWQAPGADGAIEHVRGDR